MRVFKVTDLRAHPHDKIKNIIETQLKCITHIDTLSIYAQHLISAKHMHASKTY